MISKLRTRSRATKAGLCPPPSAVPASVGGDADDVRVRIRASGSAVAGKLPGLLAASTQGRSDENGHVVEGAVFTWSSSDARVALVYLLSGLVRGAGEGTATITATAGDASGTSEITVVHPDRVALVALYNATDGPNWVRQHQLADGCAAGRVVWGAHEWPRPSCPARSERDMGQ